MGWKNKDEIVVDDDDDEDDNNECDHISLESQSSIEEREDQELQIVTNDDENNIAVASPVEINNNINVLQLPRE